MIRKLLQWVVALVPVIYLLLSWAIVLFFQQHSYEYLLAYYKKNWPTAFDVTVFVQRCLTPAWYNWVVGNAFWLHVAIGAALVVYFLLLKAIRNVVRQLFDDIVWVTGFVKGVLLGLTVREKWLFIGLFVLIGCYRLYFFVQFPMHPDEVASYLFLYPAGAADGCGKLCYHQQPHFPECSLFFIGKAVVFEP